MERPRQQGLSAHDFNKPIEAISATPLAVLASNLDCGQRIVLNSHAEQIMNTEPLFKAEALLLERAPDAIVSLNSHRFFLPALDQCITHATKAYFVIGYSAAPT